MTRRELVLALVAISLSAACKSGNGISGNDSKPSFSYAQGNLSCGDAGQDPDGGAGATLVVCTLDFGGVPIGQTSTANISLENNSSTPYNVLNQTKPSDPQFGVQQLPLPTQVQDNVPLAVSFKPFSEDQLSDSFFITTDTAAASKVLFNLTGSGINIAVALNPTNLDFGKVIIHSTEQLDMVVQNLSTGDITLSPLVPQGISASLFSVAVKSADFTPSGTAYNYGTPIPTMGTVHFTVTFAPTQQSYADEIAYLTLTYASDKYVNVGLKGFGVKTGLLVTTGPVGTNPPAISFGHIPLNNSVTDYVYVQNISNQTIKLFQSYMDNNAGGIFTVAQPGSTDCLSAPPQPAIPPNNCQQITPGGGNYTLNPGDKLTYPITFAPVYGQGYVGDFSVADDHGDNVTVPITGGGGGPAITCQTLPATPPVACSDAGVGSCSKLDFGEVAVDIGAALSLVCTNTGNDITIKGRIDPTAELQVLQSGLIFSQAGTSFSAQLFQSGQMTQFVSLRAGEQFVVQVTYDPTVASSSSMPETGTLHIVSNAVLTPSITVLLSGSGLVLTDCNLTIAPITLNFEQVTTGQTALLPVTLINNGNNACLINGLSLSPSTDPAFTIASVTAPDAGSIAALGASPPTSVLLCGTAEPASDNCTSNYGSEYQVLVQFKPTASSNYQGLLDFIVSSRSAPAQDVPLSGSGGTGCLIINPQDRDFGNVGVKSGNVDAGTNLTFCKSDSRKFVALNTCGTPLIVSGLTNSTETTDFRISSSPQLPYALQVGLTFEWEEQFDPASEGAKYGSANVVAAPSGGTPETYLAAFHGTAGTNQQVDTYDIPAQKVDIIWVINWGNFFAISTVLGLNTYYPQTSGLLSSLSNYFNALGSVDYHLAVVSSIDCVSSYTFETPPSDFIANPGPIDGDLQILPCSGCTDNSGNTAQIIKSTDSDPAGELTTILTNMNNTYFNYNTYWDSYNCPVKVGYYDIGSDILQPAFDTLTASVQAGHNTGFYRDDAALVIIGLSTGDDGSPYLTGNPLNYYYTYFENLKGFNPLTPFIFNVIGVTPAEYKANQSYCPGGYGVYLQTCPNCGSPQYTLVNNPIMVQETGGQLVDICTTDWGTPMSNLGQVSSAALTSFSLSGSPVDPPSGIQVAISGAIIPQYTVDGGAPIWTYDAVSGTLTFPNSSNAPGSGDTLTITYDNVCF
jgi:hypothetical protein